ncbi:MAG: purine-nucleoside phosphorylase [Myxococcales bacterium]|nr:purine-nucleoside phosphorylase [Myxococcales bacterium]
MYAQVRAAADHITRVIAPRRPAIGLILGSGLGAFADALEDAARVPYEQIPGFAGSGVEGHAGRLVAGTCRGVQVLAMQGRVHCYEGHALARVVLPARAMITAGCRTLIITNSAGGIRDSFTPGDLVLISDHINLIGDNPLVGANEPRFGPRFPDMTTAYDPELRALAQRCGRALGLELAEGVYAALLGPSYETPAEIRMLRAVGADLAGMSTAPEVIAARHMGARVLGISCVTNKAAGLAGPLSHDEVTEVATRVRATFVGLLERVIAELG